MNWSLFKSRYPLSFPKVKQFHKETGLDGDVLMLNFFHGGDFKNYQWIKNLREMEAKLNREL